MTTNAEKLARELIALNQRYSRRDFDRACELLITGEFFAQPVRAAKLARRITAKSDALMPQLKLSAVSPSNVDSSEIFDLSNLLIGMDDSEKGELIIFAERMRNREILPNGSSARAFADQLGLRLPKSIPSRPTLARKFVQLLREIPRDKRSNLLQEANRIGTGESSLKRWSDIIVKPDIS